MEEQERELIEDMNEFEELNLEERLKKAIYHLARAGMEFQTAGFTKTADGLLTLSQNCVNMLERELNELELAKNKLSNQDFDDILGNILAIKIEGK